MIYGDTAVIIRLLFVGNVVRAKLQAGAAQMLRGPLVESSRQLRRHVVRPVADLALPDEPVIRIVPPLRVVRQEVLHVHRRIRGHPRESQVLAQPDDLLVRHALAQKSRRSFDRRYLILKKDVRYVRAGSFFAVHERTTSFSLRVTRFMSSYVRNNTFS